MIIIKSKHEIQLMRESGKVTGWILNELSNVIKPGISTFEIDSFVEKSITGAGMQPTFKGYQGYPASACVSVNEEVVHGIPDKKRILQEGDIVSVDIGATHKGYVSDCARTYGVGQISDEMQRLIDSAKKGFYEGIKYCKPGQRLSDIGHAIQKSVEADGYGVVRELVGHGVGSNMHEDPQIPNYGRAGRGPRLQEGMTFAIEPMITKGTHHVVTLKDGWTVVTLDRKPAAHYENTLVITEGEPELLTLER